MRSATLGLGIGAVMTALGIWIGLRALTTEDAPLTGSLGLDLAFAVFFIARGGLQYRRWRLARERSHP